MDETDINEQKIYQLRKKISTIEWDMNFIKNDKIKQTKQKLLNDSREELKNILKKPL